MRPVLALTLATVGLAACAAPPPPPDTDALVAQARQLDLDGDHDGAVAIFRQAIDAAPDSFDAHYGLGRALDLAGDYEEARAHFDRALELAPDELREQTMRMIGIAWTFVGNATEAARLFGAVYDRRVEAGNFPAAAEVANELGRVYLELGDVEAAEAWYRRGYDTAARQTDRPTPATDLAELRWAHAQGRIAARRGRAEDAWQHVAEAAEILDRGGNDDQRIQLPYLRGYVALHLGDPALAATELGAADQDDPFILLLEAQAQEQLGHVERAREFYARVLESASHGITNAIARPIARERTGGATPSP